MSNVWFTSDTHFGHGNIIKYCHRPFLGQRDREALEANGGSWHDGIWKGSTSPRWRMSYEAVSMMNEAMFSAINANVGTDDTLWHLGDFCFAPKNEYYKRALEYRTRINCKNVNLVWGNHDHRSIKDLFSSTYDLANINVDKQNIVACHYAMAVWNRSHRGSWHLYGHSHGTAESWLDKAISGRKSIDVGVDHAYKLFGEFRPFSMDDLRKIMNKRGGNRIFDDNPTEEEIQELQRQEEHQSRRR